MALVLFLAQCLLKGFTLARVLLLVLPFAACIFLDFANPARGIPRPQTGAAELRQVLFWADLYLALILAWVVAFPVPLAALPSDRAALYKRIEWAIAVVLAADLALGTVYMTDPIKFLTPFEAAPVVAGFIRLSVLAMYFFLLLKLALRSEFSISKARQD